MLSTEKGNLKSEIFSKKEREEILKNIFRNKEINSAFLYKGNGGEFYDKISNSETYNAHRLELSLIDQNKDRLQRHITKYLTDIGCGNGEKAIHILDQHDGIEKVSYIASDYSSSMIELAEKNLIEHIPNVKIGNHQVMRPGNELFTNNLNDNTYLRVGCTIGNFSDKSKIVEQLRNMNNNGTLKGNKIIFSYFDTPNTEEGIEKIKNLYNNQEGSDFILNGVRNLGLDTNDFEYNVTYDKKENCAYMGINARKDLNITIGNNTLNIKKGDFYPVEKSKRFSINEIKEILKESGAKIEDHISENGISIVVAKKDPKYYHKTMKIMGITGLLLLGTLAGGIGGYKISDYNQKKKSKDIAQDKIKQYDIDLKIDGSKVWNIRSLDEKERYLNSVADAFIGAYGTGKMDKEDIFYMIVDCFGPNSFHYENYGKDKFQKLNFIKNELIPQNEVKLKNNGIDLEPYKDFSEYEDAFINSRSDTSGVEVEKSFTDFMLSGSGVSETEVNKIGTYVTIYGSQYDIGYITRDRDFGKLNNFDSDFAMGKYKIYLVAKSKDSEQRGFSDSFSVKNAKYLCEDYFLRTRPQIQSSCDIIKVACHTKEGYFTDKQIDDIQTITTQYFIKNRISRDELSKYQEGNFPPDLLNFVYDKILKDNSTAFKKIGIDPIPYHIFNEFVDAFKNTQTYRDLGNDLRGNDDFLVPSSDELSKYNEKHIGDYIDQEGNSFGVFYITVEGKRYIIANERKDNGYNNDKCILYGNQVREDFQKNRYNK